MDKTKLGIEKLDFKHLPPMPMKKAFILQYCQAIHKFNFDNSLSQDIQFISLGDTYDCDIIALCIHNGADARGGMTDYKIFKMDDEEQFLGDLYIEYVEGEEARA